MNGAIIEEGDHEGLLLGGGHYATLYNTYFRHQSLEYVEQARVMVSGAGEEKGRIANLSIKIAN